MTSSDLHEIPGFPRYTYDAAGNRTDAGIYNFVTPGAGNRYIGFHDWRVYYDLNGRVTARAKTGDSLSYSWNAYGKLTEVKRNGTSLARFGYDASGRRVWRAIGADTTRFFHDGSTLAMDVGENGRVQQEYAAYPASGFIYGIKNSSWTGIIIDEQYSRSTLTVVDYATGHTEIKRFAYSPYGLSTADTGKVVRQRFAGTEYDQETGLHLMGARYYDPLLGRFLSEDPIGIAGGLNLYHYANNDPIGLRDPTGREPNPRCDPGDAGNGWSEEECMRGEGEACIKYHRNPSVFNICGIVDIPIPRDPLERMGYGWASGGNGGRSQGDDSGRQEENGMTSNKPACGPVGLQGSVGVPGMVAPPFFSVGGGTSFGLTSRGQFVLQGTAAADIGAGAFAGVGFDGGVSTTSGELPFLSWSDAKYVALNVGWGPSYGGTHTWDATGNSGVSTGIPFLPEKAGYGAGAYVSLIGRMRTVTLASPVVPWAAQCQ